MPKPQKHCKTLAELSFAVSRYWCWRWCEIGSGIDCRRRYSVGAFERIIKEAPILNSDKQKEQHLHNYGTWNAAASAVKDSLFDDSEFFDPRDFVLVKYEMLRRVRIDGVPAMEAAQRFGFSRAGFYKVRAAYERSGVVGLIPTRPGPRQAHKLTDEILEFIDKQLSVHNTLSSSQLAVLILQEHQLSVHPRSIERALARREKKETRIR